ncbi:MAG TPA: amidase [Bryobacteraceae bacterium]|jgi:amidase|nr:amidase [Bryobacteraceae bacterium]
MHRRKFLGGAAAAVFAGMAQGQTPNLEEATIADLSHFPARELTERYLARIRELDPVLRSVIEINPDALDIAAALDRGPKRGPLHGMPVLIKDNIDTADRMHTTAGSLALVDAPSPRDAGVVERLRAAGAVLLGKTNLSEWANFRSTRSVSGWSGRGGQTHNPYALDRSPCGSSSGSGAAVSANLCALAVGTETDGSIVCPSSMNGVVGIKPTVGLLSGRGIIPISHSQDTAGPMARTVRDAAILLGAMAEGPHAQPDYTKFLAADGLRGARLGIPRKFYDLGPDVHKLMDTCLARMKDLGATLVDPADLPSFGKYDANETLVLQYEFKNDLNAYLEARKTGLTLGRLIAFNDEHRRQEMPYFEQEIFVASQQRGSLNDVAYLAAQANNRRLARAEGIDAVLKKYRVDAIVAPTAGPAWLIDWVTGDHDTGGCSTPAAVAGYPHITVPAGFVHGLPVGLSFFGTAWSEPVLLRLAYAFEQATKVRRPPHMLLTVQFG